MNGEQLQAGCHRNTGNGYRNRPHPRISAIALALSIALAGIGGVTMPPSAMAQATSTTSQQQFSIPAGSLREALDTLASRSGITVMYSPDLVAGKTTRGLSGSYAPIEALRRLLQGSGLEAQDAGDSTFTLRRTAAPAANPTGARQAGTRNAPTVAQSTEPETQNLEKITVTGTRIRGGATPSPVIAIDAENIREEGFTDLGEVIRSVPQNFSGGQNPGVFMGNVTGGGLANQNVTGGSGLNLRGLGPDASLTLLNGRRMSYGGFVQAVDISAIPVEAVERIEIVADGASAIYGSDAVGGVANVILKRDFDGFALGARYGIATDGGLTTSEYTATAGGTWASGGLIATYKDLSTDPIYAHQRNYSAHLLEPSTIYPGSDLHSGLLGVHQAIGNSVELRLDALRTERKQTYRYYFGTPLTYDDLASASAMTFVSPSIEILLPNDWSLTIGGGWGKDERILEQRKVTAATGVSNPYLNNCHCNESLSYEAGVEGPMFELPGGDARVAMGIGYRGNEYTNLNYLTSAPPIENDETVRFAYAEFSLPLIGEKAEISSVRRLAMTAAIRSEDYDSFGRVTTPKLGLIYAPSADFSVKTSWGKSFKAPTLFQRAQPITALLRFPAAHGGVGYASDDRLLAFTGGNPHLEPERARTWAASLAFHPEALPGLEAELTWFDIDYTSRVVQPVPKASEALSNPNYAEFVDFSPSPEEQAELLALAATFLNSTGTPYDPERVVAILDARYVNAIRQRIKGADLSGSYRFDLGAGQMTIRGSTTWLDSAQQTAGTSTPYDLSGTLFNPAKINGRIGAVWKRAGFSASTFANYIGGVTNLSDRTKGTSFTTLDATLRYMTNEDRGAWSGLELALSASNVFDRAPPLYVPNSPAYVAPYDSTNYSGIGRFLSLSMSKRW